MTAETSSPETIRVVLTGGFSRLYTNGVREFNVQARTVRGVISAMNKLYPGLGDILEEDTSIAIDGVIHEIVYTQPVPAGAEVFFIPRIEAG
jgi:molybdopterin synthase sulfur carrier subunit